MDSKLRVVVYTRSRGRCDLCGEPASPSRWECHHRKLKSQGGPDSAVNLITLHRFCHSHVHLHPKWSYGHGFLVPSVHDPEEWRVYRHKQRWQQPTADGWVGAQPHPDQAGWAA